MAPVVQTPRDARRLFETIPTRFFGVGVSAYLRIVPAYFIPGYELIAFKNARELGFIESLAPVFCVERELGIGARELGGQINTLSMLNHPAVQKEIAKAGRDVALIIYKSYPHLEQTAEKFGWRLIGNPGALRERLENKLAFRNLLRELNLPVIEGETVPFTNLNGGSYDRLRGLYGERLIFQIPDITNGGGRGTFLVDGPETFDAFRDFMNAYAMEREATACFNALRYVPGQACSVTGCVTRHGALLTPLQAQITNAPEVIDLKTRWGAFCGHSWGAPEFSPRIQRLAGDMALKLADYLREQGFKGVFGVDFIADEDDGSLYPVELNPRLTGAAPMLSLLHLQKGIVPLEVFHVLEFLDVDYDMDPARLNREYGQGVEGGHIILFNKLARQTRVEGELRAGTYRFDSNGGALEYRGPGLSYRDMDDLDDVVVTDGVPFQGAAFSSTDEFTRVCRILFPGPICDRAGMLTRRTAGIIEQAYRLLDLRPAERPADWRTFLEPENKG